MSIALARLQQERKLWRRDHPIGFYARPAKKDDGSTSLMTWDCGVPGKEGSIWEGGIFPVTLHFSSDYPAKPPKCQFPKGFLHPNVYPSGTVCLSILAEDKGWRPTINVRQILLGIQDLLDNLNEHDPAQVPAYKLYVENRAEYNRRIRQQVRIYTPVDDAANTADNKKTEQTKKRVSDTKEKVAPTPPPKRKKITAENHSVVQTATVVD